MSRYGYANNSLAQGYAALIGVVLVVVGLLGFIQNPIVATPTDSVSPIFHTDAIHNIVHLATGAVALFIAFGLRGEQQANGVIGFGILYVVILLAVLVSPTLFGLLSVPANPALHVLHASLAITGLAVGYMAKGRAETAPSRS
ncbi:MAG: DUF4383 domain-containing protein [Chloroflexi bacterium]|jgi:hypothetical protein|nr:DUF4383 domain-containing protein [Chloroflexota bacterium]